MATSKMYIKGDNLCVEPHSKDLTTQVEQLLKAAAVSYTQHQDVAGPTLEIPRDEIVYEGDKIEELLRQHGEVDITQ